ncbi:MAG: hypothetical protein H6R21_3461 [Proteobacteria bacterium]|nr:hypothetical protein [Pseudomonadota bacterium]
MVHPGIRLERRAVDVFHHDVTRVFVCYRVVNRHNMRMRQLAGKGRLGHEQLSVALTVLLVAQGLGKHGL